MQKLEIFLTTKSKTEIANQKYLKYNKITKT